MADSATKGEAAADARVMRSPRTMDLELTSRCNLRCRYCYYFDNEAVAYEDLPTDAWFRLIDELGAAAVMSVTLQGGEPFMRDDWPMLIERIVSNRMRFAILTNGTLVDDAGAARIAGTGRCDTVQVSLDGHCAEVHDATRGAGSFEKALRGLNSLQRQAVPVGVRVTVNRHNVAHLDAIARFLLEEIEVPNFGTNAACFFGSCRQHADDVMLGIEDRVRAMETLVRLADRYPGRIMATAGPLAEARRFAAMEAARRSGADPFSGGGHLSGCGCVYSSMAVRADGAYVPCVMLAHLTMGQISRDRLVDVWRDSPILRDLRKRSRLALGDFEMCADCAYIPYCTGNCPGLSYTLTGKVDHPSPDACLRAFMAAGGRLVTDRKTETHPEKAKR